jgi:hypothetical protein
MCRVPGAREKELMVTEAERNMADRVRRQRGRDRVLDRREEGGRRRLLNPTVRNVGLRKLRVRADTNARRSEDPTDQDSEGIDALLIGTNDMKERKVIETFHGKSEQFRPTIQIGKIDGITREIPL